MDILKENKAVLIIVVIIIALLAFYGMSNGSGTSNSLISSTNARTDTVVNDRELLQLLTDMRKINLEGHIFESPAYTSLQDFSRSIVPEPVGRQDPFAPLPKTEITVTGGGEDLSDQVLLR